MANGAVRLPLCKYSRLSASVDWAHALPDRVERGQTALITQRSQVQIPLGLQRKLQVRGLATARGGRALIIRPSFVPEFCRRATGVRKKFSPAPLEAAERVGVSTGD
jgi:hypothetical protein